MYILKNTNFLNVNKILYLSGDTNPDYLRCLTLHGFKLLFKNNCHDFPKVPHIYKSENIDYTRLYGKGFTYSNLIDQSLHDDHSDHSIIEDIQNKVYDIVIYGSLHRGLPYYDLVQKIYDPSEIILLCGEDLHYCNCHTFLSKGNTVFIREL